MKITKAQREHVINMLYKHAAVVTVEALPEEIDYRGNASAIDDETDRETEQPQYWRGARMSYKVIRHYFQRRNRTIKTGLTLEQAQAHCSDPETSSSTCTNAAGKRRTKLYGPWFDGYTECKR